MNNNPGHSSTKIPLLFILTILLLLSGCLSWLQRPKTDQLDYGYMEVKGSDTMVNLVQSWAESYMELKDNTYISVTGGGSGTGIAALINDNTDIAASSRDIKKDEIDMAMERGVQIWEFAVAMDGLAVAVNKENPIDSITTGDLEKVFTGKITDWAQLGWQNGGTISLYSRQSNSGTYVFFNEQVMNGEDWAPGTKFLPGSASINDAIKADPPGIGYYGVGYLEGVKELKISKDSSTDPVSPLELDKVARGEYPLSRPLFLYINGRPKGTVQRFLEFALSEEGQRIVVLEEYYPIGEEWKIKNNETLTLARGEVT